LAEAIVKRAKAGTPVVGICGGYQMLGKKISDPLQVEFKEGSIDGLGLLDNETTFNQVKTTTQVTARVIADSGLLSGLKGIEVTGYEIHLGQTRNGDSLPAFQVLETPEGKADYFDGMVSSDYLVFGTYLHGLFHNINFTHAFLNRLRQLRGLPTSATISIPKSEQYDKLAEIVRQNLDTSQVYQITLGRNYGGYFRQNIKDDKATG
jgi:adenosylcobyric acid synthase